MLRAPIIRSATLLEGSASNVNVDFFVFKPEEVSLNLQQLTEVAKERIPGYCRLYLYVGGTRTSEAQLLPMLVAVVNVCLYKGVFLILDSAPLEEALPVASVKPYWGLWFDPEVEEDA